MRQRFGSALLCGLVVALGACAPAAPPRTGSQAGPAAPTDPALHPPSRPLVMAVRYEVSDLAPKRTAGGPSQYSKRAFNAALALVDGAGATRPYVAASLPQLNTDTWKVFPDGRMETTYRLRPDLTWHDGTALSAEDFVFSYRVYTAPGLGAFTSRPQDQMEEVLAPDARTLVIRWRSLYGDAGALMTEEFDALPRHIVEVPFVAWQQDPAAMDALLSHPFWSTQYVGLGPFKLERWEPGSSLEGSAFDKHALGRPKVERLIIRFIPDENTVMTNVIAGSADLAADNSIRFEHAAEIRRQMGDRGVALMRPGNRHWVIVQLRPEILKTQALLDLRVRRALAHAIDREPINEALFEGQGHMAEHWVPRQMPYWQDVDRAVTKYPFDPRRVEQLMGEAGFTKRDGYFTSASGERFKPEFLADGSPLFIREMEIIQATWASVGIDMDPKVLPAVSARMNESRTTFPDLYATTTGGREHQLDIFSAAQIATAARNWAGVNRGAWTHPDFERWWAAYGSTLDRAERNQQVVEMMRVVTEHLPGPMLYFNVAPIAHTAALRGPEMGATETLPNWNMHEFEFR